MTDLFEEVEEQLRSDRYQQFARTALPWLLGAAAVVLAVVLGYWGWDSYRTSQVDKASEQYSQAMEAMGKGDEAKAREMWTAASKGQAGAYKALSLMHLAAFATRDHKDADAVRLLDEAAKAAPDPVIGDAARLKSAFAVLDTAPLKDVEARLKPLMEDGRPYRMQAREALAFAKLNAGDVKGARSDFVLLSQSLDAGQGAQGRAQAAIGLIDAGSAKVVPAVAKAAAMAPPPMPFDPGLQAPPQGQPQATAPQ